jgi:uncharacterized protein
MLSKYFHLIEVEEGEIYALYNALWLRVIFVEAQLLPLISGLQKGETPEDSIRALPPELRSEGEELIQALKKERFLDHNGDQEQLARLQHETEHLPVSLMYLIVTRNCNLMCDYCYLAKALCPKKNADMTIEVAQNAIDLFASALIAQGVIEGAQIIFYGGEPMANPRVVEFALDYATKKIPGIQFIMNSNGTLVTAELAQLLAKHHVNVAISIDGPKETHDRHRIDRGGRGTFDRVVQGLRVLQDQGVDVGISCTITPENVGHLTGVTKWLISELGIRSLGFNLLMGHQRDVTALDEYQTKAARALIDCFKITRDAGVYEDRMMRRVNSLSSGNACVNDCGGCGQQIVVTPDGRLGVCQAFMETGENFIPMANDFDPTNHPLWRQWARRSPFNMADCQKCQALSMCGGGCPYNGYLRTGNIMSTDTVHCAHAKEALNFLLEDLWQKSKV